MAIPINLLLWGCESWALKQSDRDKIQRFHSKAIRRILNINMIEVCNQQITNEQIYMKFNVDPIENVMVNKQLHWLGKVANMPENRIPRKFLNAWHRASRPVGRPQQTMRHTYIHALQLAKFIPEDDYSGKLADWVPKTSTNEWNEKRKELTPRILGRKENEYDFNNMNWSFVLFDWTNLDILFR